MILVLPTVEMSLGRESARDRCGVLIDRDHYGTVVADGERCSPLAFCATSGIHQLVLWHQPLPLLRQFQWGHDDGHEHQRCQHLVTSLVALLSSRAK